MRSCGRPVCRRRFNRHPPMSLLRPAARRSRTKALTVWEECRPLPSLQRAALQTLKREANGSCAFAHFAIGKSTVMFQYIAPNVDWEQPMTDQVKPGTLN